MAWDEALVNRLVYEAPNPAEGRVLSYPKAVNEARAVALLAPTPSRPAAECGPTRRTPANGMTAL